MGDELGQLLLLNGMLTESEEALYATAVQKSSIMLKMPYRSQAIPLVPGMLTEDKVSEYITFYRFKGYKMHIICMKEGYALQYQLILIVMLLI